MTTRLKGVVVTLNEDMREDDAEDVRRALLMVKHVIDVRPVESNFNDQMNREQVRFELERPSPAMQFRDPDRQAMQFRDPDRQALAEELASEGIGRVLSEDDPVVTVVAFPRIGWRRFRVTSRPVPAGYSLQGTKWQRKYTPQLFVSYANSRLHPKDKVVGFVCAPSRDDARELALFRWSRTRDWDRQHADDIAQWVATGVSWAEVAERAKKPIWRVRRAYRVTEMAAISDECERSANVDREARR